MPMSCYVSKPGSTAAELMTFLEIPRIGELLNLPNEAQDFEVVSIRHSAQPPSARTLPAIHVYLAQKTSP
jgi:hypothetical protein